MDADIQRLFREKDGKIQSQMRRTYIGTREIQRQMRMIGTERNRDR